MGVRCGVFDGEGTMAGGQAVPGAEGTVTGDGREVETTFRVRGFRRESVPADLAALEEVAGYRLEGGRSERLDDVYFDTPDASLERADLATRLRRRAPDAGPPDRAEWVVALKGDERRLPSGATSRLEREMPWSPGTAGRVLELLAEHGVEPAEPRSAAPGPDPEPEPGKAGGRGPRPDPVAALRARGLVVIQRRRTQRRRFGLRRQDGDRAGEVALDRVGYRLGGRGGRTVLHVEVEVEGRGADADETVGRVGRGLRRCLGPALRRWPHDKLATGRAIERLWELGELGRWTGPGGALTEEGYARLESLLRRSDR